MRRFLLFLVLVACGGAPSSEPAEATPAAGQAQFPAFELAVGTMSAQLVDGAGNVLDADSGFDSTSLFATTSSQGTTVFLGVKTADTCAAYDLYIDRAWH